MKKLDSSQNYLTIPGATRVFGIGRTTLYTLLKAGKIKGKLMPEKGRRPRRLIQAKSLRQFLENCPTYWVS